MYNHKEYQKKYQAKYYQTNRNLCLRHSKLRYQKDNGLKGIYKGILQRSSGSLRKDSKYYKEKGIKCMWKNYQEFKKDMYNSYLKHLKKFGKKNTSIDRIDSNRNYCKENCRWATWIEQENNRKNNVFYRFKNNSLTLAEWARKTGIDRTTLYSRRN